MARSSGRNLTVWRGGVKIAAIRTKSPTVAREPIDVTTDDDDGWRTLLAEAGQRQLDLSFAGVTEDDVLIAAIMAASPPLDAMEVRLPSGAKLAADFFFASLAYTGEYNQSVTFEGEMQSSGPVTFTPAA